MRTENLLRVPAVLLGDLAGEINLLVAMRGPCLLPRPCSCSLGAEPDRAAHWFALSFRPPENDLTNRLFSCLMRGQEPEQMISGQRLGCPTPRVIRKVF